MPALCQRNEAGQRHKHYGRDRENDMKNAIRIILTLLALFISGCGDNDQSSSLSIKVVFNDIPYPTEKFLRIGYTLSTWEYEKDGLELQKIIILNRGTGEELFVIEKEDLPKIYKDPVEPSEFFDWDTLTNYYLSIQLPIPLEATPPETVIHEFVFTNTVTREETTVDGGVFSPRINESPVVIASPVRRNNLVFVNQSTMGYHFYVLLFTDGDIFGPERYAFDTIELNDTMTAIYEGDPKANESYFNYGSTLYAVADGVVVHIQDGLPENHGDAQDVTFNSAMEYAGNYLMLDIGEGKYACYCHCIPGSFLVGEGDSVKEGDPIALLGNSGNSTAPHLHFQLCDGPEFFSSIGIPVVLNEYTKTGEYGDSPVSTAAERVTGAMMEETTVFRVD